MTAITSPAERRSGRSGSRWARSGPLSRKPCTSSAFRPSAGRSLAPSRRRCHQDPASRPSGPAANAGIDAEVPRPPDGPCRRSSGSGDRERKNLSYLHHRPERLRALSPSRNLPFHRVAAMREVVRLLLRKPAGGGDVGFDLGWAAGWSSAPRPRGSRLSLVPVTHGCRA